MTFSAYWDDAGYVKLIYGQGTKLELEHVERIHNVLNKIFTEGKMALMVDTTGLVSTSKEARQFAVREEVLSRMGALVVINNSLISRTIFWFFATFTKPPYPIASFSNAEHAAEWLRPYMQPQYKYHDLEGQEAS